VKRAEGKTILPLHEQVRVARDAAGLSQYRLAKMIGATPDQISRLESDPATKLARGRRGVYPSVPLLSKVARALNTSFVIGPDAVRNDPES
jgi:transcriptional regulator with XRE-family HTH domain